MTAFRLACLSDLHLTGIIAKNTSFDYFDKVLRLALDDEPDFLLLTGDLVNNGDTDGYDWLFDTLDSTALPYACLAGNHDVTLELGSELPYEQRQFFSIIKDTRLIDRQLITLGTWQLICLNTAVNGHEHGHITAQDLAWLDETLTAHHAPTLLAMHHHPIKVGSDWIDKLMLNNADELFAILSRHQHCQNIICGHVHQAHILQTNIKQNTITLLTNPACSRQFLPFSHSFATDTLSAGYRMIELFDTGQINSYIKRI